MSNKKATVKMILEDGFVCKLIRETSTGFKINIHELHDIEINTLARLSIEKACDVNVKRSGTGVVVLVQV